MKHEDIIASGTRVHIFTTGDRGTINISIAFICAFLFQTLPKHFCTDYRAKESKDTFTCISEKIDCSRDQQLFGV